TDPLKPMAKHRQPMQAMRPRRPIRSLEVHRAAEQQPTSVGSESEAKARDAEQDGDALMATGWVMVPSTSARLFQERPVHGATTAIAESGFCKAGSIRS